MSRCLGQLIHRKIKMMNIYKTILASMIIELILDFFIEDNKKKILCSNISRTGVLSLES